MYLLNRMAKPETFIVKEYEAVDVDASLYMDGAQLLVYPEVLERDYVSIRWKKGRPAFFAGGYVGVIPINQNLVLDVRPKVPLNNLERIIKLSNHAPYELFGLERSYAIHHETAAPIEDFLIDSFLERVGVIYDHGFLKTYSKQSSIGGIPKGRIDLASTIRLQAKGSRSVAFSWSERHANTPQNRLIKQALLAALNTKSASKDKRRRASLAFLVECLDQVSDCEPDVLLEHPLLFTSDSLPDARQYYLPALVLARLILQGQGLGFSGREGEVLANSLLLDLDAAFEGYIRFVLQDLNTTTPYIRVFDGNIAGEKGGKKELLLHTDLANQIARVVFATPDILIEKYSPPAMPKNIVLDMKYKDTKLVADRNDLNQLIAYAASYSSKAGVFVFPARSESQRGLQCLGTVAGIPIYQYFINLGSANILEEEARLRDMVQEIFNLS